MGGEVPLWSAFVGGFLSFLSLCVLPLLPPVIVLLLGAEFWAYEANKRGEGGGEELTRLARHTSLLVAGFVVVFVLAGATGMPIGRWMRDSLPVVQALGGTTVALLGFMLMLPARSAVLAAGNTKWVVPGSLVVAGGGLAAAWTPCIGPVLAMILLYGSDPDTVAEGARLMAVYGAGLGIALGGTGLGAAWLGARALRGRGFELRARRILGAVLLISGVALAAGQFALLTAYLARFGALIELTL